jgi:hypothetical protein
MSQVRPKGEKVGEIAAKAVVQLLFATGKSFTVDGLRDQGSGFAADYPGRKQGFDRLCERRWRERKSSNDNGDS